MQIRRGEEVTQ